MLTLQPIVYNMFFTNPTHAMKMWVKIRADAGGYRHTAPAGLAYPARPKDCKQALSISPFKVFDVPDS
jgi:hypothetical protein